MRLSLLGANTLSTLHQVHRIPNSVQVHLKLRELRSAGLVLAARNHFTVVPAHVVPVLVALAAAAGPSAVPNTTVEQKEQP